MTQLDYAIALAERGWPVFPCDPNPDPEFHKHPLNTKGHLGATLKPKAIEMQWRSRPDALIGVALPKGTVALDVDRVEEFAAAGLALPDGPGQKSYHGGYHRFFATDGRVVRQTVKEVPGADTRVGGRGYVIAWEPDAFPTPDDLPYAPEWLYDGDAMEEDAPDEPARPARRPRANDVAVVKIKMGERDNKLTSIAGMLRRAGMGPDPIFAALKAMVAAGQVEQTREDPIKDKDLRRIAGSIGVRGSEAVTMSERRPPERHFATDLLAKNLRPLEYPVDEILPEGLGVVAGAPKVGKSWLTFQTAIELATGGEVLGRPVQFERPVLYYGLEDGERRFQKRMQIIMGARPLDLSFLELRYEAPRIGEGLEDDIADWLDANAKHGGGVVFVDVLAKVRPASKGRGSAYDEDYSVIAPLQEVSKARPGTAIAVVTHDRKAGSEDFLTTVTGTRGITGAADWVWVIKRERLKVEGQIYVTGRDIEHEPLIDASFAGIWTVIAGAHHGGTPKRDEILDALMTEGDMTATETWDYLHPDQPGDENGRNGISDKLNAMVPLGLVTKYPRPAAGRGRPPVVFHYVDEKEREANIVAAQAQGRSAMSRRGAVKVRRVHTGGAPARERGTTQTTEPHKSSEYPDIVGSVSSPQAPARPRAPAHTRTREIRDV